MNQIDSFRRHIDPALESAVERIIVQHDLDRTATVLSATIRSYLRRPSKRLRPYLLTAAARAFGARDDDVVLRLAVATELLHLFALMHDDLIDQDPRVEAPSNAARVLGGDLLFAIGYAEIVRSVREANLTFEIVSVVDRAAVATLSGQAMELEFTGAAGGKPTLDQLFALYDRKTAWYSFVAPLQIGALCAGAQREACDLLAAAGRELGRAFQLHDDATDIAALVAGRPVGAVLRTVGGAGGSETGNTGRVPLWEFTLALVVSHETATPIDRLTSETVARFARGHAASARATAERILRSLSLPGHATSELASAACAMVDDSGSASVS